MDSLIKKKTRLCPRTSTGFYDRRLNVSFRFVETKRWLDFVTPGSQAAEASFFGFEPAFRGLDNG